MDYKRVLSIQDISCFGQCSLTVALPIISACGIETAILPTALLSTHTAGFKNFVCEDLSEFIKKATAHWNAENIKFDAVYSGYLGLSEEILLTKEIMSESGALCIVDPVMGDGGKLYPAFDMEYVKNMRLLCAVADVIVPNLTEACFLTGETYTENYDEEYIKRICEKLLALGAKSVALTGIGFKEHETGVFMAEKGGFKHYAHKKLDKSCHGTGDVFASVLTAALMRGASLEKAAKTAADFVVECMENTPAEHWYGVAFEPLLLDLANTI